MSVLVMNGLENLEGRQFGTLRAVRMVRRSPEPSYAVVCERCSTESTATHTRLRNGAAVCRNSSCGKVPVPSRRDLLAEQRRIAAERQAEAERSALEASAARMESETQDYERPERYTPTPEPKVMSDRERRSLAAWRAEQEAAERERLRPIREAERAAAERIAQLREEQQNTLRQIHAAERERIAFGTDEAFAIDPATTGESAAVPIDKLDAWHKAEMGKFLASNPDYYSCPENLDAILSYLNRNAPGLKLISAVQVEQAYKRLNSYGLLKQRPTPAKPAPTPKPVERTEPKPSPKPINPLDEIVEGWEIDGSAPRRWTQRELDRLSSTDYRKALHLYKADLQLTNLGPTAREHEPYAS